MPPIKKPKFVYSHDDLLKALEAVEQGESVNSASKRFGVPQSTLANKVSGKSPIERRMGPTPILGIECENILANWMEGLLAKGFPLSKHNLLSSVQQVVKDLQLDNKLVSKKLGAKWLELFLNRHPHLTLKIQKKFGRVQKNTSEKSVRDWFTKVNNYLKNQNLMDILLEPDRVFNMGEIKFFLCPSTGEVLGIKGETNTCETYSESRKDNLTVLCNVNAAGKMGPPLLLFPGQKLPLESKLTTPKEWWIAKSETGWINDEIFFEYFANSFFMWVKESGIKFPIAVFLDGHTLHMSYHLSMFCLQNNIIPIALPPNCTHILQPLDVTVFLPLKQEWPMAVQKWCLDSGSFQLTKYNFASFLREIFEEKLSEKTITNSFRRCGLSPFNPEAVDYSKLDILCTTTIDEKPAPKKNPPSGTSKNGFTASKQHRNHDCLKFFEQFIKPDLLKQFEKQYNSSNPIWDQNDPSCDLYEAWRKAKDFLRQTSCVQLANEDSTNLNLTNSKTTKEDFANMKIVSSKSDIHTKVDGNASSNILTPDKVNNVYSDDVEILTNDLGPSTSNAAFPSPLNKKIKPTNVLSPCINGNNTPSPQMNYLYWSEMSDKKVVEKIKQKTPAVIGEQYLVAKRSKRDTKKAQEELKIEIKRITGQKRISNVKNKTSKSIK